MIPTHIFGWPKLKLYPVHWLSPCSIDTLKNGNCKSYNIKLLHWNFSTCNTLPVGESRNVILFLLGDSSVYAMGRSCVYKEKWFFSIIYATESNNGQIEERILQGWNKRLFHMPIYLYPHPTCDHTLPFVVQVKLHAHTHIHIYPWSNSWTVIRLLFKTIFSSTAQRQLSNDPITYIRNKFA